jgi:hypothetical protein
MDPAILDVMARILERIPLHTILIEFLERPEFKTSITRAAIIQNAEALVCLLFENPDTRFATHDVAFEACTHTFMSEITTMGRKANGLHFSARKASSEQIKHFSIADMSRDLQVHASSYGMHFLPCWSVIPYVNPSKHTTYKKDYQGTHQQ